MNPKRFKHQFKTRVLVHVYDQNYVDTRACCTLQLITQYFIFNRRSTTAIRLAHTLLANIFFLLLLSKTLCKGLLPADYDYAHTLGHANQINKIKELWLMHANLFSQQGRCRYFGLSRGPGFMASKLAGRWHSHVLSLTSSKDLM